MARFVKELSYDQLPAEVIEKAKCCLINEIAIGLSCYNVDFGRIAKEVIKAEELNISSRNGATIFCDGTKVTVMGAAFANAVLFHSRAQDDTLGSSHAGAVITPAVLALGEREGCPGREILEAMVSGYEIVGPFDKFISGYTTPRGFRASPIFGIFGSASAASKLLQLDYYQISNALGYAAAFASGTLECFMAGTMEWRFEVGIASREGIMASLLAKCGAKSALTSIEGETGFLRCFADTTGKSDLLVRDLGKTWSIMGAGFKPYPVCAFNQTPVRSLLGLIEDKKFFHKDVKRIEVRVNPYEYNYAGMNERGPFNSIGSTLMSTPFCIALTLVDGKVTLEGLLRFNDNKIKETIDKIYHIPDENVGAYCCEIVVETKGGKKIRKESYEGPEYYNFNMEKTVELATRVTSETGVPKDKVERMIEFVQNIEKEEKVSDLTRLLGSCH
jgi:2-methylcitrate dehydratase PrpD